MLPERVGLQPYITIEIYQRLKVAFREYRRLRSQNQSTDAVEQNIVYYAGWMGHYVADGSQPLHTTINYDGWVEPNPNGYTVEHGIHSRFETDFVATNIKLDDLTNLVSAPIRLPNPFRDYYAYLQQSHALIEKVYQLDKTRGFAGTGSPEAKQFAISRLAAGTQMLLNLWYTAWIESGEQRASPAGVQR